jgi:CheY-like chemotaxis protein
MPEGGRLTIETSVVGSENGAAGALPVDRSGFLKLSVSDTGSGMDTATQRRVFDPFFTTKESGKGTGLGLYIVHSVVSNHSGYINLYSEPGKGTRINVYLPYTGGVAPETAAEPEDLRGSGTVLVIDDEAHVRELCKDMLEPLGYTVLLAPGGEEGVGMFRVHRDGISLVLLDIIMPKMGGSEVFQALKMIRSDVKVLLCSGYSHSGFAGIETLLKNGALGLVQKPFSLQAMAGAVKRALTEGRA